MAEKKRNAKGEGSFTTNPDGTVTHRKSVGYKANGNRKILTVTASTKSACIKEMKKKEAEWNRIKNSENIGKGNTVNDLCEMHLKYQVEQGELKHKSIDRRECTIEKHIAEYPLGRMQLASVKVMDIDHHVSGLINEKRLSASSIEKVIDVLNAAYNWAIVRGELEFNPVAPIKPTLVKRLQKMRQKSANEADVSVLSVEEERIFVNEALLKNPKTGEYVYAAGLYSLLLLYTGMRCGEMLALRWKDIDFDNKILTIEKSRSVAKNRNKASEDDKKYVVVEGTTKNEKARKIKLTPEAVHIFRRTFATRMYEKGVRVKEIAAYIGDLESTTERYYIAVRKKVKADGVVQQIVQLPTAT